MIGKVPDREQSAFLFRTTNDLLGNVTPVKTVRSRRSDPPKGLRSTRVPENLSARTRMPGHNIVDRSPSIVFYAVRRLTPRLSRQPRNRKPFCAILNRRSQALT